MSVLDLQKMSGEKAKGPPAGSRGSKGCGNVIVVGSQPSGLSLALC
jgi:Lanthionine-containing peptide SapB precursor RamS